MNMRQYLNLKRWRLPAIAVLTAITALAVVATSSKAFAQQPGESSKYTAENVGGNALKLRGSYSEARNGGHLLAVWRGATNNQVWMAFDNGRPFTLGTTETLVSPTVVPVGSEDFAVFHTGTDERIYYADVAAPPANWNLDVNDVWSGNWFSVPGQTTDMAVSVVQFSPNSYDLYMVYRGSGSDERIYGTWNDDNGWHFGGNIGGGDALSAPNITFNPRTNELWVMARGTDTRLWSTHQPVGAPSWPSWTSLGVTTFDSPNITTNIRGYMEVSILDINFQPQFATFDPFGDRLI
jgi:hypothetical protein